MTTIFLPWPPREAHPNASRAIPQGLKDAKRGAHKTQAYYLTKQAFACRLWTAEGPIALRVTFHPPNRNRRDLDGCISAMKWGFDGLAEAMGVDDSRFTLATAMGDAAPPFGHVLVEIQPC